ncbi:MAG: class I SAM-dependent methyltransferase [Cyanobacteria bacterium P01_G01_bin.67]
MPRGIHDSALIVNAFRARKADISGDRFADLWLSQDTQVWASQYTQQVGLTEVLVHALRHRFFLESVRAFLKKTPDGVFINIGAGFTNYPYLIPQEVSCCEIDTPVNLIFKKETLARLVRQGYLPERTIEFIPVNDLNKIPTLETLMKTLKKWLNGQPSFVLCEGLFFYLKIEAISFLYQQLSSVQQKGDIVASNSFRPEETKKIMFQKLIKYCRTEYKKKNFIPTNLPTKFYEQQPLYSLLSHENYYRLSEKFAPGEKLENPESVLEEDVYLLERC